MNFKETTIAGTSWTRCIAVTITNPLPGKGPVQSITGIEQGPTAFFQDETVLSVPNGIVTTSGASHSVAYDPEAQIQLLDPNTGLDTGESITQKKLYEILFSLYIQTHP